MNRLTFKQTNREDDGEPFYLNMINAVYKSIRWKLIIYIGQFFKHIILSNWTLSFGLGSFKPSWGLWQGSEEGIQGNLFLFQYILPMLFFKIKSIIIESS